MNMFMRKHFLEKYGGGFHYISFSRFFSFCPVVPLSVPIFRVNGGGIIMTVRGLNISLVSILDNEK